MNITPFLDHSSATMNSDHVSHRPFRSNISIHRDHQTYAPSDYATGFNEPKGPCPTTHRCLGFHTHSPELYVTILMQAGCLKPFSVILSRLISALVSDDQHFS
ncbi:hypothetical protein ILYODFUR_021889 [Ilyodon furcidens]|uniref:Uncharacterized protein n=1 Tax=Ilyodon furcidens TaxID=33524 RepID=A0ABV0TZJ5_9TELE